MAEQNMTLQARAIPAKCPKCGWEGKLDEADIKLPIALLLRGIYKNERIPHCPDCGEMVHW